MTQCSPEIERLRKVLGAFYKTVDVMKSARNQKVPMPVWADDMKAVEDVMLFLENLRDAGPATPTAGGDEAARASNSAGTEQPVAWQVMSAGDGEKYLFYDQGAAKLMHKELYDNGWDDVVTTPLYSRALAQPSLKTAQGE